MSYNLIVFAAYASTDDALVIIKDEFYDTLMKKLNNIAQQANVVVARVLNERVESGDDNETIGKFEANG